MIRKILTVLAFSAATAHAGSPLERKAFAGIQRCNPSTATTKSLDARGGAIDLDTDAVAKGVAALNAASSAFCTLSPKKAIDGYGLSSLSPTAEWIFNGNTAIASSISLTLVSLVFQKAGVNTAVGIGLLANLANILQSILNDSAKELGLSNNSLYAGLVVNALTAYACLSGSSYGTTAIKAFAVFYLLTGIFSFLAPAASAQSWGVDAKSDEKLAYILRCLGMTATCHAVFVGSLALGVDVKRSMGYGLIPALVFMLLVTLVTKETKKLELPEGPLYAWMLIDAFALYALAFHSPKESPVTP